MSSRRDWSEFSGVGCDGQYRREDQEEHAGKDSQKHLILTASLTVGTKEQLHQKLLEQDRKHKEEEEELRKTIVGREKKMKDQLQQKLLEQDKKHKEEEENLKKMIGDQETKIDKQEEKMKDQLQQKLLEQDKKHKEEEEKLTMMIADLETKIDEWEKKMIDQLHLKLLEQDKKHEEEEKKLKAMITDQEMKMDKWEKKMKDQLQQKLLEQDKKHKEEEKILKVMIAIQETKMKDDGRKLEEEQEKKLKEQKEILERQFNLKLQELKQILVDVIAKSNQKETKLSELPNMVVLNRKFEMKNFSGERAKNRNFDWFSPAMYTHVCGYKFCIQVDANGFGGGLGKSVYVVARFMSGEYDDLLKWPVKVKITLQLINQQGGENACHSETYTWKKPTYYRIRCWLWFLS